MIYCYIVMHCFDGTRSLSKVSHQNPNVHIQNANQFLDHLSLNLGIIIYRSSTNLFFHFSSASFSIYFAAFCFRCFSFESIASSWFLFSFCFVASFHPTMKALSHVSYRSSDRFATFDYYDLWYRFYCEQQPFEPNKKIYRTIVFVDVIEPK